MVKHEHWTILLKDIKIGDRQMNICPIGCDALVDSGTSLITFESPAWNLISNELGSNQLDCQNT